MEMENKTTKLRIVIHTLYKRGYNFQKSAIIFSRIRNFHAKTAVLAGLKSYFSSLGMKSREEKLLFLPWDEK